MKWALVGVIMLCNAVADVCNSAGMKHQGEVEHMNVRSVADMLRKIAHNHLVIVGIIAMIVAFFALLSVLSIANVSFAIPATAGSVLIETILAKLILGEDVTLVRWAGAVLVAVGVALLAF
jgi:multidrug transporter EmrE-like cation transporter